MRATSGGHLAVVDLLLETPGVDPGCSQETGATALHIAAGEGYDEIVGRLLEGGADPGARDNEGRTPADVAALEGHAGLEQVLRRAEGRSAG
jgi:ankyrin repeat protein